MRLESLVSGEVDVVGPETTLAAAAGFMMERSVGALAVVARRDFAGIVTDRDIVRAAAEGADLGAATVVEWMTEGPDVVSPDTTVEEAAEWLLETGYRHLPVVDEDGLRGIIDIRDVLWTITRP